MIWHSVWKRGSNGNWPQISSSFTEVPQTHLKKWWSCTCLQFECSHGTTACHVIVTWPFFPSKSSLLCRSWHVSNPAETRVKVLFRLFILCANREIMYFRIMLKKTFGCVKLQKIDNISAGVSSSLFTWKRGWNKRNLKTGQIFEIKKDAVKIFKHMMAEISMIAYKNCSSSFVFEVFFFGKKEKSYVSV